MRVRADGRAKDQGRSLGASMARRFSSYRVSLDSGAARWKIWSSQVGEESAASSPEEFPPFSTSLSAIASPLFSLPAGVSAPQATGQNVVPVACGLSSSHPHRDSSFWVPIPKSQGRFLIGSACIRCLPLNQSTAAREGASY